MSLDAFFAMQTQGGWKERNCWNQGKFFQPSAFHFHKEIFDSFMHNKQLKQPNSPPQHCGSGRQKSCCKLFYNLGDQERNLQVEMFLGLSVIFLLLLGWEELLTELPLKQANPTRILNIFFKPTQFLAGEQKALHISPNRNGQPKGWWQFSSDHCRALIFVLDGARKQFPLHKTRVK